MRYIRDHQLQTGWSRASWDNFYACVGPPVANWLERGIEKLINFRFRKHGFSQIRVEVHDRFDGDKYMCRLEVFKGGKGIEHRVMKHEGELSDSFVKKAEKILCSIVDNF